MQTWSKHMSKVILSTNCFFTTSSCTLSMNSYAMQCYHTMQRLKLPKSNYWLRRKPHNFKEEAELDLDCICCKFRTETEKLVLFHKFYRCKLLNANLHILLIKFELGNPSNIMILCT